MLLGQLLVIEGILNATKVQEALAAQVLNGGRLGTNLVELGYLDEKQLAWALGKQHGINFTQGDIVPSPDALALVDPNFADEKDVLPVRVEGNRLYLLVVNPNDIATRDYISAKTGKRIIPVVVAEFRMAQLLRRYCKAFRPVREIDIEALRRKFLEERGGPATSAPAAKDLIDEEDFEQLYAAAMRGGGEATAEAPAPEPAVVEAPDELQPPSPPPQALRPLSPPLPASRPAPTAQRASTPVGRAPTLLPPSPAFGAFARPPAGAQPAAPVRAAPPPAAVGIPAPPAAAPAVAPPAPAAPAAPVAPPPPPEPALAPIGFAEAQKALAQISDRDGIAQVVLRFAAGKFSRALLLHVQRDMATGWQGAGKRLPRNAIRRVGFSLRRQSVFKLVRDSRSHFLGPLRPDPVVTAFLDAIGDGEPKTAVLMPILAAGRVVNILYGDNGPGKLASPDIGELLILAQSVGRSYEAMIAKRRAAPAGS